MWKILLFIFLCRHVNARTDEEIKAQLTNMILNCTQKVKVPFDELLKLSSLEVPTNMDTKCLLACAYKMEGSINSKGLYDLEHAYKVAKSETDGDEKRSSNAIKLADICSKINDEEVSDGEKGCERSSLLFKCLVENAPKLNGDYITGGSHGWGPQDMGGQDWGGMGGDGGMNMGAWGGDQQNDGGDLYG